MNRGDQTGLDYSLSPTRIRIKRVAYNTALTRPHLYCRDYGGRTRVEVKVMRGDTVLTTCELRIPLDSDRDTLPDFYESNHQNDPLRGNGQVFDPEDPQTHRIAGIPPMASGTWEHETQDPPAAGGPAKGRFGDGLVAFEEYRGFFHGDHENDNHRHHRTSPHRKDVFARSTVNDVNFGPDMGLGFLLTPSAIGGVPAGTNGTGSTLRVHRINEDEWSDEESKFINANRTGIPNTHYQRAMFIKDGNLDSAHGIANQAIETGDNGVCNTSVAMTPPPGPQPLDGQVIPEGQGQRGQRAIGPGPDNRIHPYVARGDRVDWEQLRIVSNTPNGHLHTLSLPTGIHANGYAPDDRVVGDIVPGADGILNPATVANADPDDITKATISGDAADPLDPDTVASAANDELANVLLNLGDDGVDDAAGISPRDTDNGDGTLSPVNPNTGAEDGFQTVRAGNDFFAGTISRGGDSKLNAEPHGNDEVIGTIEDGDDDILQSRPENNDFVVGYVEDGGNGFLDPTVNNAGTPDHGVKVDGEGAGTWAAMDDYYDPNSNYIFTGDGTPAGDDGIRNTLIPAGCDDRNIIQNPGCGTPHTISIDCDDRDGTVEAADNELDTKAAQVQADDKRWGRNEDVNRHHYAIVDVQSFNGNVGFIEPYVAGADGDAKDIRVSCGGAGNRVKRQRALCQTIAHELGHTFHVSHLDNPRKGFPTPPDFTHTEKGIMSKYHFWPPSTTYDNDSLKEIRIHGQARW